MKSKIMNYFNASEEEFSDWKWQYRHRIETVEELEKLIQLSETEKEDIKKALEVFPMAISPYYASLIDPTDPNCPIRMQAVPSSAELKKSSWELEDPLCEDKDSPSEESCITHRYPDRVLFLISNRCGMYCRHCTRKRRVGNREYDYSEKVIREGLEYIREHPEIRDVLLSGGDALLVSDERLDWLLGELFDIPHVEIVRIGSRVPVTLPQRITPELCEILEKYPSVWLNTHFNHPKEITPEAKKAMRMLAKAGVPLGNQSVLLRGVNDCPMVIKKLCHELLKIKTRPYYLYQCDLSFGLEHFRTSVSRGIEIIEMLRGHTSGLAVPTFVVDAPGGGGKIPVGPNYLISSSDTGVVLRNYEGVICMYPEPEAYSWECQQACSICDKHPGLKSGTGIAKLYDEENDIIALEPESLERKKRF
ncbi:lysine 2,3-aminomutase [Methanosarcina sp. A14]|uniref:L-lysine 2,3-aminomutase n=2 Tax=Methanosarcina barkeri TaxID=2208 RepID=A0A0G3CEC4_METBA|nr:MULTISPECIES: lysine 2,3-aminomutase [Methanosarcina]AKJ40379.1 lysine-2,3-aminomutase AblA [Methanosarcina barkeri CM1]OED01830.1 lysine 2,3-aminomutase [Methanosarcina sp. A14]